MSEAIITLVDSSNRFEQVEAIMARPVNLGTWSKVRVGILYDAVIAGNIFSPVMALGFCHGTTNVFGDASADHFVGVATSSGDTLVDQGDYHNDQNFQAFRFGSVSGVHVGGAIIANWHTGSIGRTTTQPSIFIVEMEYGSPNYNIKAFHRKTWSALSLSDTDLYNQLKAPTPSLTDHVYTAADAVPVDESTDGTLDAINLFFGPSAPYEFHVLSCAVAKLA